MNDVSLGKGRETSRDTSRTTFAGRDKDVVASRDLARRGSGLPDDRNRREHGALGLEGEERERERERDG